MRIFIDDGSTNIKVLWEDQGRTHTHVSPNSFRREWCATLGTGKAFNYIAGGERYSFDRISPDTLPTNHIEWQYSPLNAVAVHHALLTSGLMPQEVEIVVTLPLSEFYDEYAQVRTENIDRKKKSLRQAVELDKGKVFTISRVIVRPESIPAGIGLCDKLLPTHSVLIIDLGGTTLDIAMVAGQMSSISRIQGYPDLGISLVTDAVGQALRRTHMETSRYNMDQLIINRHDDVFLKNNINDPGAVEEVRQAIRQGIERLCDRVIEIIDRFKGYTHVTVAGGGAFLVADAIRDHVNLRNDRFYVADDPQLALVHGLLALG